MNKKLENIEKQIKQLQQQKNKILKAEKEKERKARTKRLIERGAMVEKYFGTSDFSNEQFEDLLKFLIGNSTFKELLENYKSYLEDIKKDDNTSSSGNKNIVNPDELDLNLDLDLNDIKNLGDINDFFPGDDIKNLDLDIDDTTII